MSDTQITDDMRMPIMLYCLRHGIASEVGPQHVDAIIALAHSTKPPVADVVSRAEIEAVYHEVFKNSMLTASVKDDQRRWAYAKDIAEAARKARAK